MQSVETTLLSVIDRFQSAALGEATWLDAVDGLARATGSRTGQIIGLGSDAAVPFNWMTEMPPESSDDFLAAGGGDPRVNRRVGVGSAVPELCVVADGDFPAYGRHDDPPAIRNWIDRFDVPHICLTPLIKRNGLLVGLAVLRSRKNGHIDQEQRRVFSHLAPHLRAAVRTQMTLTAHGASVITEALEALSIPAFVCDAAGRVLAHNLPSEALLSAAIHLRLRNGVLAARNETDGKAFAAAVFSAACGNRLVRPVESLVVRDATGTDPLLIDVAPLPRGRHPFGLEAAALVMVRSRRGVDGRAATIARVLFDLTLTEAAVVADLVSGLGVTAIARNRGSSVTTIRTHVRRIFEKANVTSQIELVAAVNARL